jgi:putative membrane protein
MAIHDWDPGRMMNGSSDGGMYGGAWMMLVLGLILLAVLATTILVAFRATGTQRPGPATGPDHAASVRDVLDQRLARGEITLDEYRSTRTLLGS